MEFTGQYGKWNSVDPSSLFTAPITVKIPEKFVDIQRNLENLSRRASILMLWLDNDREGENISEEVESVCKKANPRLEVYRARFSALSPRDLWHALNNPTEINRADSQAVRLRAEVDLRTGAAFTRFQTLRYQKQLSNPKTLISYGSCQFPTLGFIVDAYMKRKNFVPEKYWVINCVIEKDQMQCDLKWCRKHLFCQLSCFAIFSSILDNPIAEVLNIREERRLKFKPFPLATVELQKRVSKYLRIDPHKTMEYAEKLYAEGYISYPRTETDSFPPNFNFKDIIHNLINYNEVSQYAQNLENNIIPPRNGKHSDNAHPPIYPLKAHDGNFRGDADGVNMSKIYKFIVHHFLACCSQDAIGMETNVLFDVGGEPYHLKGLRIVEKNWLEIYPYVKWEGKIIPEFIINEKYHPKSITMDEKVTQPPQLLREPDLIAKMDKEGIGTDATIAEHIKTIQDRGYTQKIGGYFHPLPLGLALILGYDSMGFDFAKPKLRADMEKTMQEISAGSKNYNDEKQRIIGEYEDAYFKVTQLARYLDSSFKEQLSNQQQPAANQLANNNNNNNNGSPQSGRGRGRRRNNN
ncbi:DNA topoisomerase 3-alpha-like [Histomonas meleagridis]|uniref:DNA topoisomerase 3-alpha-like n=1 Tax=Histomonas meleagridis TaxID=135588 RepID=UPI003559F43D|nr:DNA topoisomerase 3-alpha-like [Histomonas meleagridis]KAH0806889.1 DNA topoisomerase 3-alpha-like [Histomonas meleagridis]